METAIMRPSYARNIFRLVFFIGVLLLWCTPVLFAADFSISTGMELINGSLHEFVFRVNNTEYPLLSRLDWDVSNLVIANLSAAVSWNRFFVDVSGGIGIPSSSGGMQDYDWQNASSLILTNYSSHDNHLDQYLSARLRCGYRFCIRNTVSSFFTGPVAEFSVRDILFTASDGYAQYLKTDQYNDSYEESQPVYDVTPALCSGSVISYETLRYMVLTGWTSTLQIHQWLYFDVTFLMSLYTLIHGFGTHILTNNLYWDNMSGLQYFSVECAAGMSINKNVSAKIGVSYESQPTITGPTKVKNLVTKTISSVRDAIGGASYSLFSIRASVTIYFPK